MLDCSGHDSLNHEIYGLLTVGFSKITTTNTFETFEKVCAEVSDTSIGICDIGYT